MFPQILNGILAAITIRNLVEQADEQPKIIQFVGERNVRTVSELVSEIPYPLDNLSGNSVLSVERVTSHTITTEISIEDSVLASARLSAEFLDVVKAELFAQISAKTGQKIGETLTRSDKIIMSAKPKSKVTYIVKWFKSVRMGECVFNVDRDTLIIPYKAAYDLHSDVLAG